MTQNAWGADPDRLDDLARKMGEAARTMDTVTARLSSQVSHAPWHGTGADRFRADWSRSYRRQLSAAVSFLRDGEATLHRNAQQQRSASSAGGDRMSGLGGGGLGTSVAVGFAAALGVGWRSLLGTNPSPAQVADLVRRAGQAGQLLEHPSLTISGQKEWGVDGQVSASGHTIVGGADMRGQVGVSYRADAEVHGVATMTASELALTAGGSAGVTATAFAAATVSRGMVSAGGRVEATARARVYADGKATLNHDGLRATAEVGAIAGASVTATGHVDVAGVGVGGGVTGYAGAGVTAKAEAQVTMQHVSATVKVGAAVGLGASLEVHVDVQPIKIAHEAQAEAHQLRGFLNHVM